MAIRTVLVVEDEVFVRLDISDYLRERGFNVLEASNAQQAIGILRKRHQTVDLVFTDVQMPGEMNGIDLARFLQANYPAVKIIVTSGHVRTIDLPQKLGPLVDKPYERSKIVDRITKALSTT